MNESKPTHRFAVLGAGNIGRAVALGLAAIGPTAVYNRSAHRLEKFINIDNITTYTNAEDAITQARYVFVCLEGDAVAPVLGSLSQILAQNRSIVVSCAAVPTLADLKNALPTYQNPRIIRVLPNIAAKSGCSTNIMCSIGDTDNEAAETALIEQALGPVYHIPEHLFRAAMALSSCGIAYALRYMRAAMSAGIESGLDADTARALVCGAMKGAATMALDSPDIHPESLIDSVCTPGGITIAGLNELEANGFTAAVIAGHKTAAKHH